MQFSDGERKRKRRPGRKPRAGAAAPTATSIRLTKAELERWRAATAGVSLSTWIRGLCEAAIAAETTPIAPVDLRAELARLRKVVAELLLVQEAIVASGDQARWTVGARKRRTQLRPSDIAWQAYQAGVRYGVLGRPATVDAMQEAFNAWWAEHPQGLPDGQLKEEES